MWIKFTSFVHGCCRSSPSLLYSATHELRPKPCTDTSLPLKEKEKKNMPPSFWNKMRYIIFMSIYSCNNITFCQEQGIPIRSRFFRRRGRTRKLKYTWKSSGHPSFRKRIAEGKNRLLKQYTPCGCESICGKQCPCVDNGSCCEKYCGYVNLT